MSGCAEDLFYQLIEKLAEMGEIDFGALFIDGTKIEANANRYIFVWAKSVEKRLKKLNEKTETELPPKQRRRVSKCRWWKMHPAEILTKKNILLQHIKLICLIMKTDYDRKGDGSVL